ncbi:MAG: DNA-directed polymerase sigma-70 factor [Labilithrix sp.]|nr:DNA-directed polymerase sigma-70 factor [Labilithrix sp.]
MDPAERENLEKGIRERWEQRDLAGAADLAVRGYGAEVYGFLVAFHRDEEDASEVWSRVTERLWNGLDRFGWHSSFRTWIYAIARNTSIRYRQERRRRNEDPLPDESQAEVAIKVRTDTAEWLRTSARDRFSALRDSLPEDDRMLLVLRVDKGLAWNDLARVMHPEDAGALDEVTTKREAARLRKRFQHIKEQLLDLKKAIAPE